MLAWITNLGMGGSQTGLAKPEDSPPIRRAPVSDPEPPRKEN